MQDMDPTNSSHCEQPPVNANDVSDDPQMPSKKRKRGQREETTMPMLVKVQSSGTRFTIFFNSRGQAIGKNADSYQSYLGVLA